MLLSLRIYLLRFLSSGFPVSGFLPIGRPDRAIAEKGKGRGSPIHIVLTIIYTYLSVEFLI